MDSSLFHVDPINLILVLVAAIAFWATTKQKVDTHDNILSMHGRILEKLSESNTRLSTLIEVHDKELENVRRNVHDLGDELHRRKQ